MYYKEDLQTITKLGLTTSQAKVYLSLLQQNKATAKTISNFSKIARQEVYRVLSDLYEKGLVEKIIAKPTEFQAVPIEDCFKILIQQKKKEIEDIEKKVTKLSKKLKEKQKNTSQEPNQFLFIHEKGKFLQKTKKIITQSQTSIDILTTQDRFQHITYLFEEEIKKALQRGVKFRVIIEKDTEKPLPENMKAIKTPKHGNLFIVKYIHTPLKRVLSIIDNNEVFIVTSQLTKLEEATTLWTNNGVIREIIRDYFETMWNSKLINKHI